ncbi:MAG: ATP-binding protein [Acidimicrobiales bacterium]
MASAERGRAQDWDWAWTRLADVLLAREVVRCRQTRAWPPDPLAGLRIDETAVDRLLTELVEGQAGVDRGIAEGTEPDWSALDTAVADTRASLLAFLDGPSPLAAVVASAALEPGAAEVLAFLCAVELDPRRQQLLGYIQDDVTRRRPTLHLLRSLFAREEPGVLALAENGRLRRAELVHLSGDGPWGDRAVAVHATVIWALVGDQSPDPDLPARASVTSAPEGCADGAALTVVSGDDRVRRLQVAVERTAGAAFLVTPLPATDEQWSAVVREATLGGFGVIVEVDDDLPESGRRVIERADHLSWSIVARSDLPLDSLPGRPWVQLRAGDEPPDDEEWTAALGPDADRDHPLTAEQLRLVAAAYPAVGGDLDAAVRRLASGRIERLARRIRPDRTWADLVLPPDSVDQLQELAVRYRQREVVYRGWGFRASPSAGLVALFAGASGTGKTMAAEIIAGDLALDLFKLDLSAVVSKYIGETEKNLNEVFDAASAGNVVLFFDEADALFGRRSEVSDAHDRYANIEVSYLLQRLESYDGVVIMATNLQKNIDPAFLRRLHAVVEFPLPDAVERRRLWECNLTPDAPTKELDLDFLARQFDLTGGTIRNAALTAAFLSAEAGTPITMEAVVRGVRREYQKLGRLVTAADFAEYYDLMSTG